MVKAFKELLKSEELKFILEVAFKIVASFVFVTFLMGYLVWVLLSANSSFFEVNGFVVVGEFQEVFYDHILSSTINYFHYYLFALAFLFCLGAYLGYLLLRPFKIIGKYCEEKTNDNDVTYEPDLFSDYRILTQFSEYFFQYLRECEKHKKFIEGVIPSHYEKIKKPVFEKVFFLHFSFFILIIILIGSVFITFTTYELQQSMLKLAQETIKTSSNKMIVQSLLKQSYIFESFIWIVNSLLIVVYMILSFNIYDKVSNAIYAYFVTMKSFMRGNTRARVHLINYKYIRPSSRAFNKYLDKLERDLKKV